MAERINWTDTSKLSAEELQLEAEKLEKAKAAGETWTAKWGTVQGPKEWNFTTPEILPGNQLEGALEIAKRATKVAEIMQRVKQIETPMLDEKIEEISKAILARQQEALSQAQLSALREQLEALRPLAGFLTPEQLQALESQIRQVLPDATLVAPEPQTPTVPETPALRTEDEQQKREELLRFETLQRAIDSLDNLSEMEKRILYTGSIYSENNPGSNLDWLTNLYGTIPSEKVKEYNHKFSEARRRTLLKVESKIELVSIKKGRENVYFLKLKEVPSQPEAPTDALKQPLSLLFSEKTETVTIGDSSHKLFKRELIFIKALFEAKGQPVPTATIQEKLTEANLKSPANNIARTLEKRLNIKIFDVKIDNIGRRGTNALWSFIKPETVEPETPVRTAAFTTLPIDQVPGYEPPTTPEDEGVKGEKAEELHEVFLDEQNKTLTVGDETIDLTDLHILFLKPLMEGKPVLVSDLDEMLHQSIFSSRPAMIKFAINSKLKQEFIERVGDKKIGYSYIIPSISPKTEEPAAGVTIEGAALPKPEAPAAPTKEDEKVAEIAKLEAEIAQLEAYRPEMVKGVQDQLPGWDQHLANLDLQIAGKKEQLQKLGGETGQVTEAYRILVELDPDYETKISQLLSSVRKKRLTWHIQDILNDYKIDEKFIVEVLFNNERPKDFKLADRVFTREEVTELIYRKELQTREVNPSNLIKHQIKTIIGHKSQERNGSGK